MALKAGLVGVNPKGVDKNGMPIATGETVDAYTKSETDTLLSTKADKSTLTANSKEFNFAYDSTTQKYGYKAGADGEFVPFEQAGGDGWNTPADLITTGLNITSVYTDVSGGYKIDGDVVLVDMHFKQTASGTGYDISGFPVAAQTGNYCLMCEIGDSADDVVLAPSNAKIYTPYTNDTRLGGVSGGSLQNKYMHVYGAYVKA